MKNLANNYWKERFTIGLDHHSNQNTQISRDFFKTISKSLDDRLNLSNSIIEIGCGTGELSKILYDRYKKITKGTDLSEQAVLFANNKYSNESLSYQSLDLLNDNLNDKYDVAVCSNTLEHFKNPYLLVDKILDSCKYLIILVPFDQPLTDGFDYEGGAGHVFRFTHNSFDKYEVIEKYTFSTEGWQYSSNGEVPLQWVVVIKGKND